MFSKARAILDGACYHLMVRGNQKQKVFRQDKDYQQYLRKLRWYKHKYSFRVYGYCLMPNHVHLFGEIEKKENLSKFMQSINRSYTAYFNEAYEKVGHLWQGRFKSRVIVKDQSLINCISYIELNPVRDNMVRFPHNYRWSSYAERNLNGVDENPILNELIV